MLICDSDRGKEKRQVSWKSNKENMYMAAPFSQSWGIIEANY